MRKNRFDESKLLSIADANRLYKEALIFGRVQLSNHAFERLTRYRISDEQMDEWLHAGTIMEKGEVNGANTSYKIRHPVSVLREIVIVIIPRYRPETDDVVFIVPAFSWDTEPKLPVPMKEVLMPQTDTSFESIRGHLQSVAEERGKDRIRASITFTNLELVGYTGEVVTILDDGIVFKTDKGEDAVIPWASILTLNIEPPVETE